METTFVGPKEQLPTPPEGQHWVKEREWRGCAIHGWPFDPIGEDYCDCCGRGKLDYPEGCGCRTGRWVYFHNRWTLELDLSGVSKILRDVYVPAMREALHKPLFLHTLLAEQRDDQLKER